MAESLDSILDESYGGSSNASLDSILNQVYEPKKASLLKSIRAAITETIPFIGEGAASEILGGEKSLFEPEDRSTGKRVLSTGAPSLSEKAGQALSSIEEAALESPKRIAKAVVQTPFQAVEAIPFAAMGPLSGYIGLSALSGASSAFQEPHPEDETKIEKAKRYGKNIGMEALVNAPFLIAGEVGARRAASQAEGAQIAAEREQLTRYRAESEALRQKALPVPYQGLKTVKPYAPTPFTPVLETPSVPDPSSRLSGTFEERMRTIPTREEFIDQALSRRGIDTEPTQASPVNQSIQRETKPEFKVPEPEVVLEKSRQEAIENELQSIEIGSKPEAKEAPKRVRALTNWMDDTSVLTYAMKTLGNVPENVLDNPVESIKLLRGTGSKVIQQLESELPEVKKGFERYDEFSRYLAVMKELEKKAQGSKTPIDINTLRQQAAQMAASNPELEPAAVAFSQKFAHGTVDIWEKGGFINSKTAETFKSQNKRYVTARRILPSEADSAQISGGSRKRPYIKEFKGSNLPMEDPIESTIRQRVAAQYAADHNQKLQVIDRWRSSTPGSNRFIKEVKMKKPVSMNVSDLESMGEELQTQKGEISKEQFVGFKQPFTLKRNQVVVWENGNPKILEFTKEGEGILDALRMNPSMSPNLIGTIAQTSAKMLRAGATAMNPQFGLYRNIAGDIQTRLLQTKGPSIRVIPDTAAALFDVLKKSDEFKLYRSSGGGAETLFFLDRDTYRSELQKLSRNDTELHYDLTHPIETLQRAITVTEQMSRFAEFRRVLSQEIGRGTPREEAIARAIRSSQEVTVNFATGGTTAKKIGRYVPYFNPALQDMATYARMWRKRPAAMSTRTLGYITVPAVSIWMLNKDNPHYHARSNAEKTYFYHIPKSLFGIKVGPGEDEFLRIKRGFIPGIVHGKMVEDALDHFYQKDPQAFSHSLDSLGIAAVPNLVPPIVDLTIQALSSDGFSPSQMRNVLTEAEKKRLPPDQFRPTTSKTVIAATQAMSRVVPEKDQVAPGLKTILSPVRLENMLTTQFAGVGRQVLGAFDAIGDLLARTGAIPKDSPFYSEQISPKRPGLLQTRFQTNLDRDELERFYDHASLGEKTRGSIKFESGRYPVLAKQRKGKITEGMIYSEIYSPSVLAQISKGKQALDEKILQNPDDPEIPKIETRINEFLKKVNDRAEKVAKEKVTP